MTVKRHKFTSAALLGKAKKMRRAVTLVEVIVATAVLVIATTGTLSYQYYAAKDAKIARAQIIGTRTAQLLLEDWMSTGGSDEYDPAALGLGFSSVSTVPSGFEGMGSPLNNNAYSITVDEVPLLVILSWSDVDYDAVSDVILRRLNAIVTFGSASPDENENLTQQLKLIRPVILTTYVRIDASGG